MSAKYKPIRVVRDVSDEEIISAVAHAISMRDAARRVGVGDSNLSGKSSLFKRIKQLGLSTDHFRFKPGHGVRLECLLVKSSRKTFQPSKLLDKILAAALLKEECAICYQEPSWKGLKLPMKLSFINGDVYDRRIENLRVLCPNCYAQHNVNIVKRVPAKIRPSRLRSYEEIAKEEGLL